MDMKLSKNFSLNEFASKDGSGFPPEVIYEIKILAGNLQILRDHLGEPIVINSGYRSPKHNKAVGGAKNSQHLYGKAADIVVASKTPSEVKEIVLKLIKSGKIKNGGVALYNTFIHYDVRDYPARW